MQKVGNILKLRNRVGAIVAVLLEQRQNVVEFAARVRRVEFCELAVDGAPGGDLLLRVFDARDFLAPEAKRLKVRERRPHSHFVGGGDVGELLAARPIFLVFESLKVAGRLRLRSRLSPRTG